MYYVVSLFNRSCLANDWFLKKALLTVGTVFREPILCKNIPTIVSDMLLVINIGPPATDTLIPGPGNLKLSQRMETGKDHDVHNFKGPGVALAMYNIDSVCLIALGFMLHTETMQFFNCSCL
ncbi:isocitrate dehydrogenase [NADP], chloroplastic/mitochondrial-like isoform X1 [Chenopodium quinoa]|nr:isocitrate dehydrogenase [NADP], chloroplastic/mitochondrial-like isoform X1 [Chenopodium quinoa]